MGVAILLKERLYILGAIVQNESNQPGSGHKEYNYLRSTIVCSAACLFFLYEFVLQVSPSVMAFDLMRDFKVEAAGLGIISGSYFLAYTFMQIPAGLFYDRFGPRTLLTIASLICALGAFAFSMTDSVVTAAGGRFFIGIGSAFAFIGCLVLVSRWFPAKYFALLAGIVQLMSSVGALIGATPLAALVTKYGWRSTVTWSGFAGLIIAFIVWLIVRDSPHCVRKYAHHFKKGEFQRLKVISKNSQSWLIALYAFTSWAPIIVFAALWGGPFLVAHYGISTTKASSALSMIWISIGLGSPLVGWWSDRIARRCIPLLVCSTIGLISISLVLYIPNMPFEFMFPLLFAFGFAASAQTLSFALVKDINKPATVGTAIGFNNMAVVAGGFLFQPLVGFILNWSWDGVMRHGIPAYKFADYQVALSILPGCFLVGVIVSAFFLRESYCQPTYRHSHH